MEYHISDNIYKSIFETNLDAILIINSNDKIINANSAAELLFGYSSDEITKLYRSELDTNDHNLSVLLNELTIKDTVKGEVTLGKKDGSHFLAEISAFLVLDESNNKNISITIRKITDHKQVEDSLIESNIKLEAVIGSMTDAVFISDVEGNFIDFNDAFATYHRFKNKDECYKTLRDFTDYIDVYFDDGSLAPLDMWAVPRALRGETASNIEYILRRKDTGETWWGSYSFAPIMDKNSEIIGSVVVGHEITHRKRREKALRDNEEKYRNIIENIQDAYIRADKNGKIIMASPSAARMYGFNSIQEMMGLSATSFYSNPEDRDHVLDELTAHGKLEDNEAEAVKKDGSVFWVSQNAQNYFDENGQFQGTETFVRDITIRKEAEEALKISEENYRLLVQYAPTFIYEIDYDGPRFKTVNDAMCQFSGYSREELLSMDPFELLDSKSREIFHERINEGLSGQKIAENIEFNVLNKDGRKLWVNLNVKPTYTDGILDGALVVGYDITERKKFENKRQELLEQVQLFNEELEVSNEELQSTTEELRVANEELQQQEYELLHINQALRKSELRLRRFYESGLLGVIYWNIEGNITDANDKFLEMMGYTRDDLDTGHIDWAKMTPPEYQYLDERSLIELKNTGVNKIPFEKEYIRKDGTHIPVIVAGAMLDKARNNGVAFVLDITERKQLEKREHQLSKRLKLALDAASMGWWHYDPITDISEYDEQYRNIFGVLGSQRPNAEILKRLHPEDLPNVWAEVEKALNPADPKPYSSEYRIFLNDGTIRWIEAHGIAEFSGEGEARHAKSLVGTVADITERKLAEKYMQEMLEEEQHLTEELQSSNEELKSITEELQEQKEALKEAKDNLELKVKKRTSELSAERQRLYDVLETIPIMICILTDDYHVSFSNRAFRDKFGESEGRHCYEYCFGLNEPCEFCESYNVLETGKPHQWDVKTPDGSVIEAYDFPFKDVDGTNLILEMDIDVTEQRQAQETLKNLNKILENRVVKRTKALQESQDKLIKLIDELEVSNKELEQFAYVSSHDLQEPIRMVTSFTQLLEKRYKGQLDADADEYINFIIEGAHRMKYLIDDLLTFSRLNTQAKEFENVNLEMVLNNVLSNLSVSIKENNALINHDPLPTVMADKSQMMQVLQNLIVNAIKFHGPNQPEINISSQRKVNEWIFSVSDNGIGIDPEYQKQIFEVFKRLHTRKEYPGSGIGLSISQKIINRHNGRIWVESELGKGSTFYFTIPL